MNKTELQHHNLFKINDKYFNKHFFHFYRETHSIKILVIFIWMPYIINEIKSKKNRVTLNVHFIKIIYKE